MVSVSVPYLFYQPMDEKIKTWPLPFPAKDPKHGEDILRLAKAKYRLISRKLSGIKFFHPSVRLTNQKPRAFVSVR